MIKKHPVIGFLALAYAFSWAIEIPLALQSQEIIQEIFPFSIHYLAGYGPLLSALIVTYLTTGSKGLRELWGQMFHWRVKPCWWLVAISPLGIYMLAVTALWLFQGQRMNLAIMGQVDYLPPLGLAAIPLWILTFGFGEETGWRGFALPRLQNRRNALSATLRLWVLWALWHLPLFFYAYDTTIIPGMLIGLLAGSVTLTWLYNSTGGSVLMTAIWHGLFNYVTAGNHSKTSLIAALISTLVMVWAAIIVMWFHPANLTKTRIQTSLGESDCS